MHAQIRDYRPQDEEELVELSLQAWVPAFMSMEQVLGVEIFGRLHGDWRQYQAGAVQEIVSAGSTHVWVAEADTRVIGFIAATPHRARRIGEIQMLAVDPEHQRHGVGAMLTDFATEWLRDAGMQVMMAETGGDAAHAAARCLYQSAGFKPVAVARFFKTV